MHVLPSHSDFFSGFFISKFCSKIYICLQGDKKLRCDSADLRHDIDRRRKERSKERGDSKGSRESSGSRKQEKTPKDYKDYKSYKDDR